MFLISSVNLPAIRRQVLHELRGPLSSLPAQRHQFTFTQQKRKKSPEFDISNEIMVSCQRMYSIVTSLPEDIPVGL